YFFAFHIRHPRRSTLFPYTTLFRSWLQAGTGQTVPLYYLFRRRSHPMTLTLYIATAAVFLILDAIMLTLVMKPLFTRHIGPLLRSEEHTSELQSRENLVCRLLLEKK